MTHTLAAPGMIIGAVVGAAVAFGLRRSIRAASVGAKLGGALGAFLGRFFTWATGSITSPCASTVHYHGLAAARVGDPVACSGIPLLFSPHEGSRIAQGSSTVLIEGMPAARRGDGVTCSAFISEGCATVWIGGQTVTRLPMVPEISWKWVLQVEDDVYRSIADVLAFFGRAEDVDVEFTDANFEAWTDGLTIEESQDAYFDETGEVISRETIELLFTDPERGGELLLADPNLHTVYRDILNRSVPISIEAAREAGWREMSFVESLLHGNLLHGNQKFISPDGHREVVYGPGGNIDSRIELMGTFNFFDPGKYPGAHVVGDVVPYSELGN